MNPQDGPHWDQPLQARADVLWREVDGETVLLDPERGRYFGIEGAGVRIWTLLQEPTTLGAVLGTMLREYEVDESRLAGDLEGIVEEFRRSGLLKIG